MKIKKTVGTGRLDMYIHAAEGRQGYIIHTDCGEKFHAKPVGYQGYECGGVSWQSLKELKTHISNGGSAIRNYPEEVSMLSGEDTWDCVHPCALLIRYVNNSYSPTPEWYMDTLEAYGWLDCMGRPDIARAEREIARVKKLKKSSE